MCVLVEMKNPLYSRSSYIYYFAKATSNTDGVDGEKKKKTKAQTSATDRDALIARYWQFHRSITAVHIKRVPLC